MNKFSVTGLDGKSESIESDVHEIFSNGTLVFWNVTKSEGREVSREQVGAYAPSQWASFRKVEPEPVKEKAEKKAT